MNPPRTPRLLIEHEALACLMPQVQSYLLKGMALVGSTGRRVNATAAEYYAHAVFSSVSELDAGMASRRLVRRFVDVLETHADPDPEEYRYHYENFMIRGIGIVDRAHLLVEAALLMIRKQGRPIDHRLIVERVALSHPTAHAALLEVKAAVQLYRRPRNEVIHASAYSHRDLGTLCGVRVLGLELDGVDVGQLARESFAAGGQEISTALTVLAPRLDALLVALGPVFAGVMSRTQTVE